MAPYTRRQDGIAFEQEAGRDGLIGGRSLAVIGMANEVAMGSAAVTYIAETKHIQEGLRIRAVGVHGEAERTSGLAI